MVKTTKTFSLDSDILNQTIEYAEKNGMSVSSILNEALLLYFENSKVVTNINNEILNDVVVKEQNDLNKLKDEYTALRDSFNEGLIDRNTYINMGRELRNSIESLEKSIRLSEQKKRAVIETEEAQ